MFISYGAYLKRPARPCRDELSGNPAVWVPDPLIDTTDGRRFVTRVGLSAPASFVRKKVELTVGPPSISGDWITIPVGWRATGPRQLFPILDGELVLGPLDRDSCKLTLRAVYQRPLGAVGRGVDEAVLRRVARGTIKNFVDRVAARLSEAVQPASIS